MTSEPAWPVSPLVSLFGAFRPDGDGAPRPMVVDLFAPRALLRSRGVLSMPAIVRAEGVVVEARTTAELEIRLGAVECRVGFRDEVGQEWRLVLRLSTFAACLRAKTELPGFLEDPRGKRAASVLLRLNWRALRLKR